MQLFYSALSPFACKVRVCAYELGLADQVSLTPAAGWTDESYKATNPLGQVPAMQLDDGTVLYDSAVICEALDQMADQAAGLRMAPVYGPARWAALTRQALADGMCEAAVRIVRERMRDDPHDDVVAAQTRKLVAGLAVLDAAAPFDGFGIGEAATACALAYFDVRQVIDWRGGHPALAAWYEAASKRDSLVAVSAQIAAS